jgi:hypothetical protein
MGLRMLIIFSLLSQVVAAGDSLSVKRLRLALSLCPEMAFRFLQNADHSATSNEVYAMDQEVDRPRLAYSAGLSLVYQRSARWSYEAGLQYADRGFGTANSDLRFGALIDRRRGFVYTSGLPANGKFAYRFRYLEMPLLARATIGRK